MKFLLGWMFGTMIGALVVRLADWWYEKSQNTTKFCSECIHGHKSSSGLFWNCDLYRDSVSGKPTDCDYCRKYECKGKHWKKKDE